VFLLIEEILLFVPLERCFFVGSHKPIVVFSWLNSNISVWHFMHIGFYWKLD
jgi:hypothetical protein